MSDEYRMTVKAIRKKKCQTLVRRYYETEEQAIAELTDILNDSDFIGSVDAKAVQGMIDKSVYGKYVQVRLETVTPEIKVKGSKH